MIETADLEVLGKQREAWKKSADEREKRMLIDQHETSKEHY